MAGEPGSAVAPGDCETYNPPRSEISLDHVLRIQGYRDLSTVRDDVRAIATAMTAKGGTLAAPTATFRKVPVDSCEGASLRLSTGTSFKADIFGQVLRHCDQVLPFVLTLGEALDNEVGRHLEKSEIVEALFLETVGWLSIEQASRELAIHLQGQIKKDGLCLTRRLGPGYKEWDLLEQKPLFQLFSDTKLPVRLLESCAMFPKKSRSGLYGLRPLSTPRSGSIPH
jgi:hypothetical protein